VSKVVQAGEFFVVGGPVQPDRPCYLPRAADGQLLDAIADGDFCYVLGPRAMGKSSLMGRTVRILRSEGQQAAVIDLAQLGAREQGADAGRWYYSIAYRVVRELRLKVDLQSWWQENSVLTREQRLVEFFLDVVLANTTAAVTVFFDEIELTQDLPYAQELFGTIRAIYNARGTEPAYDRLNFVVLGTASPRVLCQQPDISPFSTGRRIRLQDFELAETQGLAPGLRIEPDLAEEILKRIHYWAAGQPYLTQKIARALARTDKGRIGAQDVDELVRRRFLGTGAVQAEPQFSVVAAALTDRASLARQSLIVLGKIQKGQVVDVDPNSAAQERLRLSGAVRVNDGVLVARNRIYAHVFTSRWVNSVLPFDLKVLAFTAVAIAAAVLLPVWYTQFLPRSYVATLAAVTQDYEVAIEAHRKLARLPGFQSMADRLLAEVMVRRSRLATAFVDMESAEVALQSIPGNDEIANQLRAEFWYRQAVISMAAEDRDTALVHALESAPLPSGVGRALVNELVEPDYRHLAITYGINGPPNAWVANWEAGTMAVVDRDNRAQVYATDRGEQALQAPLRLTATQVLAVTRELPIDEQLATASLSLVVEVDHPRPEEIAWSLRFPDGSTLARRLTAGDSTALIKLGGLVTASSLPGIWRLSLADTGGASGGKLVRWGIVRAGRELVMDTPEEGLAIPNPIASDEVKVVLSSNGKRALVVPANAAAGGAISLWDLSSGKVVGEYPVGTVPQYFGFLAEDRRFFVCCDDGVVLHDSVDAQTAGQPIASAALAAQASADGEYLGYLHEQGSSIQLRLVRAADGEVVATVSSPLVISVWSLGPAGGVVAFADEQGAVSLIDTRQNRSLGTVKLPTGTMRLVSGKDGFAAVAADASLWWIGLGLDDGAAHAEYMGRVAGGIAVQGDQLAYVSPDGLIHQLDLSRRSVRQLRYGGQVGDGLVAVDQTGRLAFADSNILRFWRPVEPGEYILPATQLTSVALAPEGDLVLLGDARGHVRPVVVDGAVEESGLDYIGHSGAVTSLASQSVADIAASGGADGVVRLWGLSSGAPREFFMRHPKGPINQVALSRDGRWLASAAEYAARVWSATDGEMVNEISVTGSATAVAFAPTNELLAVGDLAGNVQLVTLRASTPLRAARAKGEVTSVAFGRSTEVVASGTRNGSVQLWSVASAAALGESLEFGHPVQSIVFSPDNEVLIVQTLHWLHWVRFDGQGMEIQVSRLAPIAAHAGPVPISRDGARLRLVAGQGSRRRVVNFARNRRPLASDGEVSTGEFEATALGLSLDFAGQLQRP
jgi:WD40 repeat protein